MSKRNSVYSIVSGNWKTNNQKRMKLKKIYLTIGMIFSFLTTFSSCNSHGNTYDAQKLIKQEFNIGKKTIETGQCEVVDRKSGEVTFVEVKDLLTMLKK